MFEESIYAKLEKPADHCVSCGVTLDNFKHHRSALVEVSEQAVRRDICPHCWEQMNPGEYFSFWLSRREKKDPQRKLSRKEISEMLLNLFDALYEARDEKYQTHLYVLAHLLMKQKTFKWEKTTRDDETIVLVFSNLRSGEVVEIPEVELDDNGLVETKQDIDRLISGAQQPADQE